MRFINFIMIAAISTGTLFLSACDKSTSSSGGTTAPYTISKTNHNNATVYNNYTDGPAYTAISVENNNSTPLTITALSMDTLGPGSIVPASDTKVYHSLTPCTVGLTLTNGQACYVFVQVSQNYPALFQSAGQFHQILTLTTNLGNNLIDVYSQGYIYLGGEFDELGDASTAGSPNYLLAKCGFENNINELTCVNAFSGNNIITTGPSNSIYTLGRDNAGNIYSGGLFTELDGVTASNGVLLAKFNPNTGAITNAFNNNGNPTFVPTPSTPAINTITFDSNNYAYITGTMNQAGGVDLNVGAPSTAYLMAKCDLSQSSNQCTNILPPSLPTPFTTDYTSINPVLSLALYQGTTNSFLITGGRMSSTGGITTTRAGSCALDNNSTATSCAQFLSSGTNPTPAGTGFVYTTLIDNDNNIIYTGGRFTTIGSIPTATGPFLAECAVDPTTGQSTCSQNALGGASNPNVYVSGGVGSSTTGSIVASTAFDHDGNVFIAGKFDTVSNNGTPLVSATTLGVSNLVVRCAIGGTACTDLLAGATVDGANDIIHSLTTNAEIINVVVRVSN